ncbi:hypothetical protein ACH5RR_035523 [Cinchona calisaya]|uniref:Uncharacterized protein n=1 Tax=Cinchona calisaya TaxID=153742 RepID=A0ABD2Y0G4_9GENT
MDLENTILLLLACSGFISVAKFTLNGLKWIWLMFIRPPKNLLDYGSWALITGSTDGIGKALAFELASKGLNLVLVGRNHLKLDDTCKEIRKIHGERVKIKLVLIDFAKSSGEDVAGTIEEAIRGLDVGILINNAGLAYPYARYFHEVDVEMADNLIRVNIDGINRVTGAVLQGMLEKKKGAIVNIGSGSTVAVSSYPLYTIYAATKAYVAMFSKCISLEYKNHGIDVQCQMPMLVATKMTSIRKSSLFIPSAEVYSKASTRWIGYEQNCVPYWPHAVQKFIMQLLPDALLDWCLLKYFSGMRLRGLKKDSRKANPNHQKHS